MPDQNTDHIWDLMEEVRFCMRANWNGSEIHAPIGAFVRREEDAIYFFTDVRAHKDDEIEKFPQVCLAFADPSGQKYVSLSGRVENTADRSKIRELWAIPAQAWWKDPGNPNLRLIKVTPEEAEFWDAPGNLLSGIRVAFALLRGTHPGHAGEHKRVAL
jgi:general stress protein 26